MDRNSRRGPLPADLFTRYDDDPVRADWEVAAALWVGAGRSHTSSTCC